VTDEADITTTIPAPAGHNRPPASEAHKLFTAARKSLADHSRHTKNAVAQLRTFLVHVMETCEYARQSKQNADEVELELYKASAPTRQHGDWFRPLVTAAFAEQDREREKTNNQQVRLCALLRAADGDRLGRPSCAAGREANCGGRAARGRGPAFGQRGGDTGNAKARRSLRGGCRQASPALRSGSDHLRTRRALWGVGVREHE
jgi:hypothetical protein